MLQEEARGKERAGKTANWVFSETERTAEQAAPSRSRP